jgi:hypothetical protein
MDGTKVVFMMVPLHSSQSKDFLLSKMECCFEVIHWVPTDKAQQAHTVRMLAPYKASAHLSSAPT